MFELVFQRVLGKRTSDEKIEAQIQYLLSRGLGGQRGKRWEVKTQKFDPIQNNNGNWLFKYKATFTKISGMKEAAQLQWSEIKKFIIKAGTGTKFQDYPWIVTDPHENSENNENSENQITIQAAINEASKMLIAALEVKEVKNEGPIKNWKELQIPPELLGPDSNKYLSEHPAWKDLYDLGPQIRVILSNIQRASETDGESRNHIVNFGHAGCGKTSTMLCLEKMFGSGSVLRLDATSTTKAGLEKLFFSDLKEIPPLIFMEEAEKADPDALKIWLGALDDRGEIRKINFRVNQLRAIKILFICSVNNKALFDRMMGSDGSQAGALSSRCVSQIYFPRPSSETLKQILKKEIDKNGGKYEWISPAISLANELGISDPRIVRHYLAGGDRLLDGSYQRDWLAIQQTAKDFQK